MNSKQHRALLNILIISVLLLFVSTVYAESYYSTLDVSSRIDGAGRYYSGSTINISCYDTYLSTVFERFEDTLEIICHKKGFLGIYYQLGSTQIVTIPAYGHTTASGSWTMNGSGTYRFRFIKGRWWGIQEKIISNDVYMWSN